MNEKIKNEIFNLFWERHGGLYQRELQRRTKKWIPKKHRGIRLNCNITRYSGESDGDIVRTDTLVNGILSPLNIDYILDSNLIKYHRENEHSVRIDDGKCTKPHVLIYISLRFDKKSGNYWSTTGWAIGDYLCFEELTSSDIEYIDSGKLTADLMEFCSDKIKVLEEKWAENKKRTDIRVARIKELRSKLESDKLTKYEAYEFMELTFSDEEKNIVKVITKGDE